MTVEELFKWCEQMKAEGKANYYVPVKAEEIVIYDDIKYIALDKEDML